MGNSFYYLDVVNEDDNVKFSTNALEFQSELNNLIVFDWDDTLFPTKKVRELLKLPKDDDKRVKYESELEELSNLIYKVLSVYIYRYKAHNIRIVSSSERGWIRESLLKVAYIGCFKEIYDLICINHKITMIHPLSDYLPWSTRQKVLEWKFKVFRSLIKDCYVPLSSTSTNITNTLISIGDSVYEFEASKHAAKSFENVFVHRIKLMKCPSIKDMMEEMNLLLKFCGMFDTWSQIPLETQKQNMTIVYGN